MAITKQSNGKWLVDIQPGGRGSKRYRKLFKAHADALRYERSLMAKVIDDPQFIVPKKDKRRLNDLIRLWFDNSGKFLSSGDDTHNRLLAASRAMGDPLAVSFSSSMFAAYRSVRVDQGLSVATLNRELQTFKAMFAELKRLELWALDNPLKLLRPIKHQQAAMSFLSLDQIRLLFGLLFQTPSDAYLIALVCLSTGARWGEAQSLTFADLSPYLVHYRETKSKKPRSVPVSRSLYDQLQAVLSKRRFTNSYSTFSRRLVDSGIELPKGQRSHVLRHTFASHFIMNGGHILTLQKILGHSSLEMTMRYAHLAPDYLHEVLDKNPAYALTLG